MTFFSYSLVNSINLNNGSTNVQVDSISNLIIASLNCRRANSIKEEALKQLDQIKPHILALQEIQIKFVSNLFGYHFIINPKVPKDPNNSGGAMGFLIKNEIKDSIIINNSIENENIFSIKYIDKNNNNNFINITNFYGPKETNYEKWQPEFDPTSIESISNFNFNDKKNDPNELWEELASYSNTKE